jgi:hypothetical protein
MTMIMMIARWVGWSRDRDGLMMLMRVLADLEENGGFEAMM